MVIFSNLPGEIPTMLLLNAAGVIPTIEPPDCPSISTTSLPSRPSGVVFDESTVKSHLPSLPATDLIGWFLDEIALNFPKLV